MTVQYLWIADPLQLRRRSLDSSNIERAYMKY
jgi:hypothetical protein